MNCRWLIWLGGCLAAAGVHANDWVLTGLAREQGRVRAYLAVSSGGTFLTLRPGEERWGWRLVDVSFRDHCVWLADATRTVRVDSATSPALASGAGLFGPRPGPAADRARMAPGGVGGTQLSQPETTAEASSGVRPTDQALPEFVAGITGAAEAGSPVADEVLASGPKTGAPRRAATADELFKARNGYGAWEGLLRRRHEAAALGLPIPEN